MYYPEVIEERTWESGIEKLKLSTKIRFKYGDKYFVKNVSVDMHTEFTVDQSLFEAISHFHKNIFMLRESTMLHPSQKNVELDANQYDLRYTTLDGWTIKH